MKVLGYARVILACRMLEKAEVFLSQN